MQRRNNVVDVHSIHAMNEKGLKRHARLPGLFEKTMRRLTSALRNTWHVAFLIAALSWNPCTLTRASAQQKPARQGGLLAITDVTLIDPRTGANPHMTIIVERGRIRTIGPAASVSVPGEAIVFNGSGRFALPGLWDAHVHISQIGVESAALFLANGVTSVRDMGSDWAFVQRWRASFREGGLAPDVYSPGPKLAGVGRSGEDTLVVKNAQEAGTAVDHLAAEGVDFIKVHRGLSGDTYDTIAAAAKLHHLSFVGHVSGEYPPLKAIAAGQRTIEHGHLMQPCSRELRARIEASPQRWLTSMCAAEGEQILPAMARAEIWFTPTLTSWRGKTMVGDANALSRLNGAEYATPLLQHQWANNSGNPPTELERELLAGIGPLAGQAAREGVHLLAGTDSGDPFVIPGFAIHDELKLMVEAGVPPLAAIRSATLEPALALGVAGRFGTVEPGKVADIVLLAGDPLADIDNTRLIVAVIRGGRLLPERDLHALVEPLRQPQAINHSSAFH